MENTHEKAKSKASPPEPALKCRHAFPLATYDVPACPRKNTTIDEKQKKHTERDAKTQL